MDQSPGTTSYARSHFSCCEKHNYKPFEMYCPKCRTYFCVDCLKESADGPFCPTHNGSLIPVSQMPPLRQKSIAVFLALFFGFIGLHYFYTGRTGAGIFRFLGSAFFCAFLSTPYPIITALWFIPVSLICIVEAARFSKDVDVWNRPLV